MNKKYAIFDMDGTLVDSMSVWRNLGREYLRLKGVTEDIEPTIAEIAPLTVNESAALFVKRFRLTENASSVAAEMNDVMASHYKKDVGLKKGARGLLETLKERGVRMCVASATAEPLATACLKRLGAERYFEFIVSCERFKTNKLEPKIYCEAAALLGARANTAAVYEDNLRAAKSAKGAGFYVVAVYDKESDGDWDKIKEIADETINID